MAISGIDTVSLDSYASLFNTTSIASNVESDSFGDVFNAVLSQIDETNSLQNTAEEEEIKYSLGLSENTHDLLIAQSKASVALQYTVAVRDKILDAYKELMQMQI